jgi:hypothetical protein
VTDKYFHAHLFDNTEQGKTEDLKRPPEELAGETANDYYQDENQEDYGYATDEYPVGDIFEETKITVPNLPPVTDSSLKKLSAQHHQISIRATMKIIVKLFGMIKLTSNRQLQ